MVKIKKCAEKKNVTKYGYLPNDFRKMYMIASDINVLISMTSVMVIRILNYLRNFKIYIDSH